MAEDAVMIDDNAKNLEGAREVGIDTILFKEHESFREQFKKYYRI
jgi:FMN phosphatase YigB (HAD superfamily)